MLQFSISILVIPLFFCLPIFFVRWLTGWKKLEKNYRCNQSLSPEWISNGSYRWVSASMQATKIGLAVEIYPEALWLRTSFPFTIAFNPLCIPWQSVESAILKHGIFGKKACLKIVNFNSPIYISGEAGRKICEMAQQTKT